MVNLLKCLKIFDEVYVSSDSWDILRQAEEVGAKTVIRDLSLCGSTPNIPVYQHALQTIGDCDAIIAVQANSPTITPETIQDVKTLMEAGCSEVMTCHPDNKVYGSVWAIRTDKLKKYKDAYHPSPDILVKDESVDIHTEDDLNAALCQLMLA